jgi:peptidoglycan lytic transglycosylase
MSTARTQRRSARSSPRRDFKRGAWRGRNRRYLVFAGAIAAGVALALALSLPNVEKTIREVTLPLRHEDIIRQQSREKGVDASLIAAVIFAESKFQDQTSGAGARGLMQITPATADTIEKLSGGKTFTFDDLADPELNIRYGTFYLGYLLNRYGGSEIAALAAYNAGQTNADNWGGSQMLLDDVAFPETHAYVKKVLEKRQAYRRKYSRELGLVQRPSR